MIGVRSSQYLTLTIQRTVTEPRSPDQSRPGCPDAATGTLGGGAGRSDRLTARGHAVGPPHQEIRGRAGPSGLPRG
jgi:hypothetical protein